LIKTKELTWLQRQQNDALKRLANAISAVRNSTLLPDESIWVDKIEKIRKQLNSCSEKIPVVDYGAGSGATWFFRSYRSDQAHLPSTRYQRRQVSQVSRKASTPPGKSLLYFKIIREMKPAVCLELGTGLGISAAYQAAALKLNQNETQRTEYNSVLHSKLHRVGKGMAKSPLWGGRCPVDIGPALWEAGGLL